MVTSDDLRAGAIDIHGHFVVRQLLSSPEATEAWRYAAEPDGGRGVCLRRGDDTVPCRFDPLDPAAIIETMDELGVGVMAIDLAPFQMGYELDAVTGARVASVANDAIADAVSRYPDRLVGMGTLPMQDAQAAIQELERLMQDHLFVGVELATNVNGVYLGDASLRPVWEAIASFDAAAFVHPANMIGRERLGDYFLANLIGNPVESARSIADVIFSGLLEELPDLRICFAHGGGASPSLLGRWDRGHAVRPNAKGKIDRPPSVYFAKLYFDHITHSSAALRFLVDLVGADHVMVGTDHPFDMGPDDPVGDVSKSDVFTETEKDQILHETAITFLGIS